MNQWLWFVAIIWIGTGSMITAVEVAKTLKGRAK